MQGSGVAVGVSSVAAAQRRGFGSIVSASEAGRRIGVLHLETFSLQGFEELDSLFDTIAGTARVA